MNRRQKQRLVRKVKMAVVGIAAGYMVTGVSCIGNESRDLRVVLKTVETIKTEEYSTEAEEIVNALPTTGAALETQYQSMIYSYDWDAEESYMLAKMTMAEAEGEDVEGKALVILVILNRVWSDEFPDSISEVIMQSTPSIQFSTIKEGGRYWTVEPDEGCWKALEIVKSGWDESRGAIYFESQSNSTWHRDHLKLLFQHGNHYFYTDKEAEQ